MADPSTSLRNLYGGIDLAALTRRIFTSVVPYAEWAGRVRHGAGIDNQRIDNALRAADVGILWPLADMAREQLSMNPKASGILNKALYPLAAADWDITPAEGDGLNPADAKRIATQIRTMVRGIRGFKQALLDLALGFFDARSALEKQIVIRQTGRGTREFWPERLDWIEPQRLSFERARRLIVISRWGDYGQFIQRGPKLDDVPGKFLQFTPRMFGDLQEREGLAPRYLFWLLFDKFNWRHRMLLAESFGIPWRMIETELADTFGGARMGLPQRQDGGEGGQVADDDRQLDYAAQEARNVVRDGVWAGLPGQKMHVEYPPAEVNEFFSQGSDQILERLAFLTLHNSATAAGGDDRGARADAVVLAGGEDSVRAFRGDLVSEVVQQDLIDVLVELNNGADALPYSPRFQLRTAPPRDRDKEVDRLTKVSAVVPVAAAVWYEAAGIRPPEPGEELATPPAPPGGAPGGPFGEGDAGSSAPALPHGEGGSEDASGALRDLEEDADADDQADAADEEAGAAMSFGADRKVMPETVHGSPDGLIERGVREAVRFTSRWAEELVDAAHGTAAESIYRNLVARAKTLDVEPFTRALERRIVHTLMLGALDADHEATSDTVVEPAKFAAGGIPNFTAMPFGEAIAAFNARKVMSRRQFDRLAADAKRKAFTVAGLATKTMLTTAHAELTKALTAGADLRDFSKSLNARFDSAGWTRLNPSHVENVFRTNIMGAYADGRRAQMTQPHILAARPYWQILGVNDARTRKTHADAHGKVLRADDPFFTSSGPPFGFQCFVPDTRIAGAIIGASRAVYAGKVVQLTTAEGRRLTVTAHHPVATTHGLIDACALRPGDELLCHRADVDDAASGGDEHEAPTCAEDVFRALAETSVCERAKPGCDDFHGEAARFDGEIDVVGSYGQLVRDVQAVHAQDSGDLSLVAADPLAPGLCHGREGIVAARLAPNGSPCASALPLDGGSVSSEPTPLRALRFGTVADLDVMLPQDATDDAAGYAAFVRELFDGSAGAVAIDQVVDVVELDWSGHVYDFQSKTGWLVAGGIIASNCRCRIISRSAKDLVRLGLTPTIGAALRGLPDPGWTADAIAPPASYEPQDGPPPVPPPQEADTKRQVTTAGFDDLAAREKLSGMRAITPPIANVNPVFTARLGDVAVYVKPTHVHFDAETAVARHRAVASSAEAMGMADAVTPATLIESKEALKESADSMPDIKDPAHGVRPEMFVTRAAPPGAVPAYATDPKVLAKVHEDDRVKAAAIDFLHNNDDRHDGNVLVDPRGRLTLIDHDSAHGSGPPQSVFFPGGGLGYSSPQRALADLPKAVRKHVVEVAEADAATLAKLYNLDADAAAAMKARAQAVVSGGLDVALANSGAYWQAVGPTSGQQAAKVVTR